MLFPQPSEMPRGQRPRGETGETRAQDTQTLATKRSDLWFVAHNKNMWKYNLYIIYIYIHILKYVYIYIIMYIIYYIYIYSWVLIIHFFAYDIKFEV